MNLRKFNPSTRKSPTVKPAAQDTQKLVKAFLKKGGKRRIFEPGLSTDFRELRDYLTARGIKIDIRMNRLSYRGKILKPEKFYALVDAERAKEGKTPIATKNGGGKK